MALDKDALETGIFDALINSLFSDELPAEAKEETEQLYKDLAKELSDVFDTFVRSGTVATTADEFVVIDAAGENNLQKKVSSTGEVT